jgi:hypothetical protein
MSTQLHISEDGNSRNHRSENLKWSTVDICAVPIRKATVTVAHISRRETCLEFFLILFPLQFHQHTLVRIAVLLCDL